MRQLHFWMWSWSWMGTCSRKSPGVECSSTLFWDLVLLYSQSQLSPFVLECVLSSSILIRLVNLQFLFTEASLTDHRGNCSRSWSHSMYIVYSMTLTFSYRIKLPVFSHYWELWWWEIALPQFSIGCIVTQTQPLDYRCDEGYCLVEIVISTGTHLISRYRELLSMRSADIARLFVVTTERFDPV